MSQKKIKLTEEQLKQLSQEELAKMVEAGYTCPTGYYWDDASKQCILDVG